MLVLTCCFALKVGDEGMIDINLLGGNWLPSIFYFPRNILGMSNHPNWRTLIFFRGFFPQKPPTRCYSYKNHHPSNPHSLRETHQWVVLTQVPSPWDIIVMWFAGEMTLISRGRPVMPLCPQLVETLNHSSSRIFPVYIYIYVYSYVYHKQYMYIKVWSCMICYMLRCWCFLSSALFFASGDTVYVHTPRIKSWERPIHLIYLPCGDRFVNLEH